MTDRNKNRPGYKETKVGWIPERWNLVKLATLTSSSIRNGYSPNCPNNPTGKWILGLGALSEQGFDDRQVKPAPVDDERVDNFMLKPGDFLVSRSNTPVKVGLSALYNGEVPNCAYPDLMMRFRINEASTFPKYLAAYLKRAQSTRYFRRAASGTSNSMVKITKTDVQKLPIPLPPLPEQKAIAEVLSCWDEGIEKLDKLIDANKLRKKGLMQKLLTGEKRLPGFFGDWKEVRLGDVFNERKEIKYNHLPLLAITGNRGIIPAEKVNKKDSSSADKSKYKRICPGDLGYNTMRMWQGVSSISSLEGIVSPAYTICIPSEELDPDFIGYLFKTNPVIFRFWRYSQGLVDDTLNLKFHNFAKIHMSIPSTLDEQRAIAKVLETADEEIRLLEAERDALAEQKKGLMQKLLTGEIRCPEFRGEQTNGVKS